MKALETPSFNNFYSSQIHRAMLYDVAELAPELDLESQLSPLLWREGRDYELARWLFERGTRSTEPSQVAE